MKINYQISKDYKKRIQLEIHDIYLLLFLNEQVLLSQPQFHQFHCFLKTISEAAFRRKMSRWHDAKLIIKRKLKLENGYEMATIELTKSGQLILKKLGLLSFNETLKYRPKINLDHTLTIKQTVLQVLEETRNKHSYYIADGGKYIIPLKIPKTQNTINHKFILYRSANLGVDLIPFQINPLLNKDIEQSILKGVIKSTPPSNFTEDEIKPDWIFRKKNTFIYIEVDSGSEKIKSSKSNFEQLNTGDVSSIEGKLYRYEQIANRNKTEKHIVIFTLIDNSSSVITTKVHSNKETRIANMKHEIGFMENFSKWKIDVYVIGMRRFLSIIKSLCFSIDHNNNNHTHSIEDYMRVFNQLYKNGLNYEGRIVKGTPFGSFEKNGLPTLLNYKPSVILTFKDTLNPNLTQHFLPIFIREGNVFDMELLAYFSLQTYKGKFRMGSKVILLYPTTAELKSDIFRRIKKTYQNNFTGETVDNNGMDIKDIIAVSLEDLLYGKLYIYNAKKERVSVNQLFC